MNAWSVGILNIILSELQKSSDFYMKKIPI